MLKIYKKLFVDANYNLKFVRFSIYMIGMLQALYLYIFKFNIRQWPAIVLGLIVFIVTMVLGYKIEIYIGYAYFKCIYHKRVTYEQRVAPGFLLANLMMLITALLFSVWIEKTIIYGLIRLVISLAYIGYSTIRMAPAQKRKQAIQAFIMYVLLSLVLQFLSSYLQMIKRNRIK